MAGPEGVPARRFEEFYRDGGRPPWDVDFAQPDLVAIADRVRGAVLDVGCGTGENALFFAARGLEVVGLDSAATAIARARARAADRGLSATFVEGDALALESLGRTFDTVIDSGLFHVFSDADRPRFVEAVASVTRPGGLYVLLCFSEHTPGTEGPRRVTQAEIRAAFAPGFELLEIAAATFATRVPDFQPHAWRASLRRP